ncbi:MAG: ATP-binding protein [Pseudomonadales bacterium]
MPFRSGTNVYTPLVEVIVNAIQAIESNAQRDGEITIVVKRSTQMEMEESLPAVEGFEARDNGIGFNEANRESFDTLYSDQKISEGGKGFGRFTCLKYFEDLRVESVFEDSGKFKKRSFSMVSKR